MDSVERGNRLITEYLKVLRWMLNEASLLDLVELDDAPNYRDCLCHVIDLVDGFVIVERHSRDLTDINKCVARDFQIIEKHLEHFKNKPKVLFK